MPRGVRGIVNQRCCPARTSHSLVSSNLNPCRLRSSSTALRMPKGHHLDQRTSMSAWETYLSARLPADIWLVSGVRSINRGPLNRYGLDVYKDDLLHVTGLF